MSICNSFLSIIPSEIIIDFLFLLTKKKTKTMIILKSPTISAEHLHYKKEVPQKGTSFLYQNI